MKKTLLIICTLVLLAATGVGAQVGINADNALPDSSAMLDVQSTNKGILVPRMTATQRDAIANPATGLLVYVNTDSSFYYFDGTTWLKLTGGTISALADADNDTKIQLEKNVDEDIIRFNLGGQEHFRMVGGRMVVSGTSSNYAYGSGSTLQNVTSGVANVIFGTGLGNLTTGSDNSSLGVQAGNLVTTGSQNTFVGRHTGYALKTGNGNVFIGYRAGFFVDDASNNKLYIENTDSNSPLIYGEFDNDIVGINGSLGVGTQSPSDKLHVQGSIRMVDGNQQAGYIPVADANGVMTWTDPGTISGDTLSIIADADNDTKIQVEESADEDIIRFDVAGTEKWIMTGPRIQSSNSGGSIFLGENTGLNDDLSDNNNVFIGTEAGVSNTTGNGNVFLGWSTGNSNISGNNNTALGTGAFANNETGSGNVAIGIQSQGNRTAGRFNVSVGANSLIHNADGEGNTAIGNGALIHNTSGDENVALGGQAGRNNALGNRNVFIGYQAGYNEAGSQKLYIENSTSAAPLIYGEFDNDLLQINGTLNINNAFSFPIVDGTNGQVLATDGNGALNWTTPTDNDNQALSLSANTLSLTNGGSVDLSNYLDNTDAQALSLSANTLSLTNGGSVDLSPYITNIYNANGNIASERILTFTGNDQFMTLKRNDNTNQQGISFLNEGTFYTSLMVTPADGTGNDNGLDIRTKNSDSEKASIGNTMRLTNSGTVTLPEYGQGNVTGTLTKMLAVTSTGDVIEANSLGDHTATERLNLNTQNILLNDGQNGNAILGIVSDDETYNTKGILIRTVAASNGDEVLSVAGSTNGVVFQVKDNGQLKIEDGNQGDGKVLTSDANGNTSWEEPADRIVYTLDQTPQTVSGNGWNSSSDFTNALSVTTGDVITIRISFSAEMGAGSGTDDLQFRVRGLGGNGCPNTSGGETDILETYDDHRGQAIQTFIQHTFQANCTGTYTFGLQTGLDNTDDDVVVDNVQVTAVKY